MNNKTNIEIHFNGLNEKEGALFDRVISFSASHGLVATKTNDISKADLIIISADLFTETEQFAASKTTIVLTNDESNTIGDVQAVRPLMITKVMNALNNAVEICKTKSKEKSSTPETLVDVDIEDATDSVDKSVETEKAVNEANTNKNNTYSSHHALVIDDSAAIRKQLEIELRDAGLTSEFAESGEDALEMIKDKHFDLVFLDIIMPGLDGYETCKQMRSNANYKKTPIIMLSGKTSPLDEVQGVIAGATTYLTKPVKSDKLQETLQRVTKWIDNFAPARNSEKV